MLTKLVITIGVLVYGLGVPLQELNQTYVLNPAWEAHERLREVWQLATNTALAVLSLWLAWTRNQTRLPNFLATLVVVASCWPMSFGIGTEDPWFCRTVDALFLRRMT